MIIIFNNIIIIEFIILYFANNFQSNKIGINKNFQYKYID